MRERMYVCTHTDSETFLFTEMHMYLIKDGHIFLTDPVKSDVSAPFPLPWTGIHDLQCSKKDVLAPEARS